MTTASSCPWWLGIGTQHGLDLACGCSRLAANDCRPAPGAGPMAPQTIGAQLDGQPTPASMEKAEQRAEATVTATLARA